MPFGTLLLGLTLLQDPEGFRLCQNACPVPSHKTPREIIQGISSTSLPGGEYPAIQPEQATTSALNSSALNKQSNSQFGEMIKKAILESITVKEERAAKPEPPKSLTIYFPFNFSSISETDEKRIFKFIGDQGDLAMGDPDGEHYLKLFVAGYTDSKGSKKYNQMLALKRARAVEQVLKKREYNNVYVEAKGKCCYADLNSEDAKNRRVEVKAEPNR
jgi:outer membrane protein OmpA-like peptidoglycan-associated protein